jgi:hypothetical protein
LTLLCSIQSKIAEKVFWLIVKSQNEKIISPR